jgi:bis(5'-nucleosyl)-tetraphosphatase (symmetrical)
MVEKTVVIGDIHACLTEFKELLELVDYKSPHVRVILLGDLIDRGPASVECVQLARTLNLLCVKGNHEKKLLKWFHSQNTKVNVYSGKDYYSRFTDEDINYISNMSPYIKISELNTVIVHAGLRPGISLENQKEDDLYYIRYMDKDDKFVSLRKINSLGSKVAAGAHFWTEGGPFNFDVVYGHNVWETPRIDTFSDGSRCIGIDTGCVFGDALTAYTIETKEFTQVKAKKEYYKSNFKIR